MSEITFNRISRSEEKKNNVSSRLIIKGNFELKTPLGLMGASGLFSLLRYDTPSELNFDDRDELTQMFEFFFQTQPWRGLSIKIPLDISLQHLVYIYSEMSANNNWLRIIRLSPEVIYFDERVKNVARFSVLANYTVFDFEELTQSVKSFAFRQFRSNDSLKINIKKNLNLELGLGLILSESGSLKWKEFKERPELEINSIDIFIKVSYIKSKNFKASLGYRYFVERRFRYENLKKFLNSSFSARGPISEIALKLKNGSTLNFTGWAEYMSYGRGKRRFVPYMNLNISINL